jgi:hypothetical protein
MLPRRVGVSRSPVLKADADPPRESVSRYLSCRTDRIVDD